MSKRFIRIDLAYPALEHGLWPIASEIREALERMGFEVRFIRDSPNEGELDTPRYKHELPTE